MEVFTRWGWIRDVMESDDGYPSRGYNIRRQTFDPMVHRLAPDTLRALRVNVCWRRNTAASERSSMTRSVGR